MVQDIGTGSGSFWGGLSGGAMGLAKGGPLGAFTGGAAGYVAGANQGQGGGGGGGGSPMGDGSGGLLGLFGQGNDAAQRQSLMDYYNQVLTRQAPQAGQANQSAYSGYRDNQSKLINRLEAMSQGQGPSLAAQQFQEATDRNTRGQQSMANSGRGGPMAQLTAANNMAGLGAQAAQGSAVACTGEEMGALSQLGSAIGQGRAQDESTNQFNAGQSNQFQLANLEARLKSMGMNDKAVNELMQTMMQQNKQPTFFERMLSGGTNMLMTGATQAAGSGGGGNNLGGGQGNAEMFAQGYGSNDGTGLGVDF